MKLQVVGALLLAVGCSRRSTQESPQLGPRVTTPSSPVASATGTRRVSDAGASSVPIASAGAIPAASSAPNAGGDSDAGELSDLGMMGLMGPTGSGKPCVPNKASKADEKALAWSPM